MADNSTSSTGIIGSSDYKLNTLVIVTSDGKTVDVSGLMIELNLYEDIFATCMTGSLVMGDSLDLISSFSLHGNEYILISVDKPSLNSPIVKTFRIYKIGDRTLGSNGLQNYTIYFCSDELIISSQNLVSKSYKGLRIDQMVSDLLKNKLKVNPAKINQIEQTDGIFDIIIPRMAPLEAIAWLCPRAYKTNKHLFLFFENRDGFNFVSYESLLTAPVYRSYSYNVTLEQSPEKNINSFTLMNIIQDFDMIKAIRAGAFTSTLVVLDIVNRNFTSINFNVKQLANSSTLNSFAPSNDAVNRLGQSVYATEGNMLKFILSTDSDPTSNPANLKKWLPQTISRLGQLNTFKIVGSIPGDIQLKTGMVVRLEIPKMEIQDKTTGFDPIRTGNFLVSSVHHKFILDVSTTIVELLADSVSQSLPVASTNSQTIKTIINT